MNKKSQTKEPILRLQDVDLDQAIASEKSYRKQLDKLQDKLTDLAIACYHNKHQIVILLEGWDAAGKGGSIRRMVEKIDPRSYHVYPISKPNPAEAEEYYLQRFWRRMPPKGHISIFDRSWYGRVLVERLEGFASESQWQRAYDEINHFEKMLTDDGMVIVKLFIHISQEEQLKRYLARMDDPRKHWKLTPEDLRNRQRADDYLLAYNDMFEKTHTQAAPWHLIAGEYKWFTRIQCLETVINHIEPRINTCVPRLSDGEIAEARRQLGVDLD